MIDKRSSKIANLSALSKKELIKRAKKFSERYCIGDGKKFKLKDYKTEPHFDLGKEVLSCNLLV